MDEYWLLDAVKRDDVAKIRSYLDNGVSIDCTGDDGKTPLHVAVANGKSDLVRLLLEKGAAIDAKENYGKTPLHLAVQSGRLKNVRLLLEKGVDIDAKDNCDKTPLYWATESGDLEIVRVFLQKGAVIDAKDEYDKTPLHTAVENGKVDVVRLLLQKGAAIDAKSYGGVTPLHLAAMKGYLDIVSLLLGKGAAINAKNEFGQTPLHSAAASGALAVVRLLLLQKGALIDVTYKGGVTPLHVVAANGRLEIVRLLLEKGAAIEAKTEDGWTPLHVAASYGQLAVVHLLLEKGAAIDIKNVEGKTPLMLAEEKGHEKIVQLLMDALRTQGPELVDALRENRFADAIDILEQETIDPNLCDSTGTSLMQLVLETHDLPLLQALLKKPNLQIDICEETTRVLAQNSDAVKALFLHAASTNDMNIVDRLLSLEISPTVTNEHGDTALHVAAASGHATIVTTLLKFANEEAYVNAINHAAESALFVAAARGHVDVLKLLLGANASTRHVSNDGSTLLHAAAIGGNTNILDQLLLLDLDVEACDKMGQTPLHVAAAKGHASAVQCLLDAKANVLATTTTGATPLMLTMDDSVRAILQRAKAKASAQRGPALVDAVCKQDYHETMALLTSGEGDSLLHLAVQHNDHKVLDALLRVPDIKMDVRNAAGVTPMILAIQRGHRRLATALQAALNSVIPEVSATEIEMDISSPLGVGGYGAVYKGIYNDQSVAIKTAANASCSQALLYEMETMQLCKSPYVLQLLAVSGATTSSPKLVLEYMDGGDLRSYLDAKRRGEPIKVDVSPLEVAWVLANALADMHHNGVLHRDLKSHNVLLSSTNYIKLADLGIAREHESNMTTAKGTPYWTAPEVLTSGSHYSFAADIYAFGVILTELDTLQLPFSDLKSIACWGIMDQVRLGTLRPTVSATCPPWLRDLADACLSFDPTQRPSAQMLVTSLHKLLGRTEEALAREPETEPSSLKTLSTVLPTPENPHRSNTLLSRTSSTRSSGSTTTTSSSTASGTFTGTTTYSSWSNSTLVSTRVVCQLCRASNSLLKSHCEACAGPLASVASKLKVLLKRLAVAKKNGFAIDDGLVCVCCDAHQPMEATVCDVCDDELPDENDKLRILVRRIEQATTSAA